MKLTRLLSATALAGSLIAIPGVAFAQTQTPPASNETVPDAGPDAAPQNNDESIVVTGSRIRRPNLDSTTPVTSVSAEQLLDTGELSLGDNLNRLPALRSTVSQANSTNSIGTAGINNLDLRGLGTSRTLVLVNGRRHVSSSPGAYLVDTNTIPSMLLERVDVITGGTSAVYGSDAIAGVVNFITKRDYDGFNARVQGGISSHGDRDSQSVSAVWGKNFAEGRGNIAVAGEYVRQKQLLFTDRPEQTGAYAGVPGFGTAEFTGNEGTLPNGSDGIWDTRYYANPGLMFGNISLGGAVATSCPAAIAGNALNAARRAAVCTGTFSPLANGSPSTTEFSDVYVFNTDGTLVRDRPLIDNRAFGGGRYGGRTATGVEGAMLLPGLERYSANIFAHYEVSPAFEPFIEAKYVHITANQTSTQPTFVNGTLSPNFFLDNPFLTAQARSQIQTILGTTSTTAGFTMNRFNNDIGTRAEDHERKTYRIVGGFRGDLSTTGNLNYEVSFNWGRTSTYYETGGNVDVAKFNAAANAVRATDGSIQCRVNTDAITTNDMPGCVPINLFGENNASQAAKDYVLYTSSRKQWAEELNAVAYVAGDSSGLFKLPGGPIGFSIGGEYRREDAFSDYDDYTQSGATFLNSIAAFDPPSISIWEGFGELRLPLLKDLPFMKELTVEGAARYSKYSSMDKGVWAWNVGGIWAPVPDIRFRVGYAKAVRAPNLSDLYATRSQTFANGFIDPCSMSVRTTPDRIRNCAAAGVPTTMTYTRDDNVTVTVPWENTLGSGLSGFNQGNLGLAPETSKSLTVGAVFEPTFLKGFAMSVDYYNITVNNVINGLSGQGIVDRCYDDPVGLNNPFCSAVFRRTSTDPLLNYTFDGQQTRRFTGRATDMPVGIIGPAFLNQPFNYAALKTSGIDADISYRFTTGDFKYSLRTLVSWLQKRDQYLFITDPNRSTRVKSVLGDPEWQATASIDVTYQNITFGWDARYVGKQLAYAWETLYSHQGRQPTNIDVNKTPWYPALVYHSIQLDLQVNKNFRFYIGADNVFDQLPPWGATGTGSGSAVWPVTGRYIYSGARITF
jgi:outer membrane receptor protein involved in Fe transport